MSCLFLTFSSYAHDFEVNGIYYKVINTANKYVGVTYEGSYSDMEPNYFGKIVLPSSVSYKGTDYTVTAICTDCFTDCSEMTEITLPETLTSIGGYAFDGCSSLSQITIPKSVKYIGDSAFTGCTKLKSLTLPEGIKTIDYCTFEGCSSLLSVSLPATIVEIDGTAFTNCESLTEIDCYATNPPEVIGSLGVQNPENLKIHVLKNAVEKYSSTTPWNEYTIIGDLDLAGSLKEIISNESGIDKSYIIFDTYGRQVKAAEEDLMSGIYIVVYSDGRTKKVMGK